MDANQALQYGDPASAALNGVAGAPNPIVSDPTAMNAARGRYQSAITNEQKEMKPAIDKFNTVADSPHPDMPKLQEVGGAPKAQDFQQDGALWINSMAVLSALAGARSRGDATIALKAFAGGVKGLQAGQQKAFENAYETWKGSTDAALKNNKTLLDKYRVVLQDRKMSEAEQQQAIAMIAHENEHGIMMAAHDFGQQTAIYTSGVKAQQKAEAVTDKVKAQANAQIASQPMNWDKMLPEDVVPGTKGLTVRAATEKAQQAMLDPSVLSRGGMPMTDKNAVMDLQAKMMNELGISGTDLLAMQAGYGASKTALNNVTKQYTMISAFENTAEKNMKIVESLMDKGAGTESGPVINRWLQAGKKATGDPDVAAFNAAMIAAAGEVAKINSGATGAAAATEGAIGRVNETLSSVDSPRAIQEVFDKVWRVEMKNRVSSLSNVRDSIMKNISSGGKEPPVVEQSAPAPSGDSGWKIEPVE